MLTYLLLLVCPLTGAEISVHESIKSLCQCIRTLDKRITETLQNLPMNEGENVLEDMMEYNKKLGDLYKLLTDHRNETLEVKDAEELLTEGAPDYFAVNFDRDKAKVNFNWMNKEEDKIFKQRAESCTAWAKLNRRSRLIPLEYYTYPEGSNYTGYVNPLFPPLKEKMCDGSGRP
uniref:SCP domain-containing protein n=1 Tax=Cuerna arida TaxID=1464854 RepID=A0A1B6GJE3_9HEMI